MKPSRFLTAICLLATALAIGGCTQDELTDGNVRNLPEGIYPLMFTATQENSGGMQTRVSESGSNQSQWSDGDIIGVHIATDTQTGIYTLNADGTIKNTNTPIYWQSPGTQTVTGWYPATGDGLKNKLLNQQANGFPYVLKGTGSGTYNSLVSLAFSHQLAKVRIMLTGDAKGLSNATVSLKGYTDFTYTEGNISNAKTESAITPKNKNAAGYYEALLIPTGASSVPDKFVTIVLGDNTFYYTPTGESAKLTAGNVYTYTITVNEPPLTPAKPITIADNGEYTITGSGEQTVTINGSPTITFQDVSLKTGTTINITGGSPTLIFEGTTILESTDRCCIQLQNNASVTIQGSGTLQANKLNDDDSPTIGALKGETCGNISISNCRLEVTGRGFGSGIGVGSNAMCGDIVITEATIDIKGVSGAEGIGCSISESGYSVCGEIRILKSDVNITYGNYSAFQGAAIGCAAGGTSGNLPVNSSTVKGIYITLKSGQTKDDFLSKLKTSSAPDSDKVGQGYTNGSKYGTITNGVHWYNDSGSELSNK